MKKMLEYNNLSLNTFVQQNLTALDLRNNQNCMINNRMEQSTQTTPKRKNRRKERKKKAFASLHRNNTRSDIETDDSNKRSLLVLHFASKENSNDTSILLETELSSTSSEEGKRVSNIIDKSICTSENLLEKDTKKISGTRKEENKETFDFLRQDEQIELNNLIDKVHTLQLANKEDSDNAFVSSKTIDLLNTAKQDAEDTNDMSISILESSTGDIQETFCMNKERNIENTIESNFLQHNGKQIDLTTEILKDKAHSVQLTNCNNVHIENMNDKDISTLESPKFIFFDIDYEFHEANHAIIDTFALNIYYSLCANDKKIYCLVCDKTFQVQNHCNLRKNLCRHIQSDNHVKLLSQMIEDDKKFLKAGKLFSKLGLARECMRNKNDGVECLLCNSKNFVKIKNDDSSLYEHILSSKHQNFKVSWTLSVKAVLQDIHHHFRSMYNAKKYCCEFCNYESESEICFAKHLRVPYHTSRLIQVPDYAERFKFHYCAACLLLWFGNSGMYDRHCEQVEHQRRILYGSDLDHLSEELIQLLIMPNQNAEALLAQSNNACFDKTIDNILCDLIIDLEKYILNIKAYPFGSRISDLAFPDSDIDIFLDCDNMYEGKNSSHHHCQDLITLILYYLSLNKTMWKVQEMILHSRTPIIKVQHVPSGFICDISATNGLAVENTKIIKCFNHAFPLCRKLILFLKQWLHICGLLGSHHLITSYALTWLGSWYKLQFSC
ncbi:uncharacterized protein LOC105249127 isoform X2 [Camponotus floridanus]|uniref:uncharacterized protein LOC105249127 isoform X2 n=1 Tax=Camponotus floridanus TaxID=104421 RepID=UPI000DC690F2|nr:uncharacterized protein LOC105249127 isoform X2 [Camponotus floridanus]